MKKWVYGRREAMKICDLCGDTEIMIDEGDVHLCEQHGIELNMIEPLKARLVPIHSNHGRWYLSWYRIKSNSFPDNLFFKHNRYFKTKKEADAFVLENNLQLKEKKNER